MTNPTFHDPLRHNPTNPRYFTDDTGNAIYLTGSHTWATLYFALIENRSFLTRKTPVLNSTAV